jgi:2-polyprenyl-3-methyl-5-hydroxy-6-metoxy-1,4-benzoquinol methylase
VSYATIDDLRSQLGARPKTASDLSYAEKMLHTVPDAPVVNRAEFILDHCRGKRVLEFGASGRMHAQIVAVATSCVGIDRKDADGVIGFDLDDVSQQTLPSHDVDVIVCGELLEHLSNPGWFLTRLRKQYAGTTTIITVPNAFSAAAARHIVTGVENCNRDHCSWLSFVTLHTLLGRAGYTDFWFGWYNGKPLTAEGIVVRCE